MVNLIYKIFIHVIMKLEKQYTNKKPSHAGYMERIQQTGPNKRGRRKGVNPHGRAKAHEGLIFFGYDKSD